MRTFCCLVTWFEGFRDFLLRKTVRKVELILEACPDDTKRGNLRTLWQFVRLRTYTTIFFLVAQKIRRYRERLFVGKGVRRFSAFIYSRHGACLFYTYCYIPRHSSSYTDNASLVVKRHHFYLAQPHWYMTCFPFLPFTCLAGASSVGVAGPVLPLPPHAFTGVLLLLCLITPAPE